MVSALKHNLIYQVHVTTCNSHKHVILQCLDIVLGAMHFRLNDKHKEKPDVQFRRSGRTIAKEKLYDHIRGRVIKIYPNFNIGVSTSFKDDKRNTWLHNYRHWALGHKNGNISQYSATRISR